MLRSMMLMLALSFVAPAVAGNSPASIRKQAESSLLVSGSVTIGTDGKVLAHTLDPKAPLGDQLLKFIDVTVQAWRFEPVAVDGKLVNAKVPMSMRLVAKKADDGTYSVSIVSTSFGSSEHRLASDTIARKQIKPPHYPSNALSIGGKGTAYMIVQVGPDGRVINVDAEQVNLRVVGSASQMEMMRKQFTEAARRAAKTWTFTPPTTGPEAGEKSWLVRVPVQFSLAGEHDAKPGEWDTYIPGPRNMGMPWAREKLRTAGNPDALPEGGVYPLQQGATLLTPPTT